MAEIVEVAAGLSPTVPNVAADVETCPAIYRRWRRRRLDRHVGRERRRSDQCGGDDTSNQSRLPHGTLERARAGI